MYLTTLQIFSGMQKVNVKSQTKAQSKHYSVQFTFFVLFDKLILAGKNHVECLSYDIIKATQCKELNIIEMMSKLLSVIVRI